MKKGLEIPRKNKASTKEEELARGAKTGCPLDIVEHRTRRTVPRGRKSVENEEGRGNLQTHPSEALNDHRYNHRRQREKYAKIYVSNPTEREYAKSK